MGEIISDAIWAGGGRLILNAPPRHGKSEFASVWVPIWFLEQFPTRRAIVVSYGAELATVFSRRARQELQSPDVGLRLVGDMNRQNEWETPQGGGLYATGIGGSLVGRGGDLIVVDDPVKNWQEARSLAYQRRVRDLFRSSLLTRAEPGATIVVVMQRWTTDDLSGWLLEEHGDEWTHLRFPAIAEPGDPLGREVGQPLCPERYGLADLQRLERAVGDAWGAVYQQNPAAGGAGVAYPNLGPWNVTDQAVLDKGLPLCLALDFNSNPGMHGLVGQYAQAGDRFWVTHVLHGPRMPIISPPALRGQGESLMDALAQIIKEHGGFVWPELWVFGDATGSSKWPGTSQSCYDAVMIGLNDQLGLRRRWRMRVPKSNPPPPDRIAAVNDAGRGVDDAVRLLIHPRCRPLIADLERVRKDERGAEDTSNTELTHASAALGYWVHYLRPVRPRYDMTGGARFSVHGAPR